MDVSRHAVWDMGYSMSTVRLLVSHDGHIFQVTVNGDGRDIRMEVEDGEWRMRANQ